MNQNDRDNRDDVIEIDLVELLGVILHNLWIIIVSGVIVAAVALLVSYFIITPKYESVTKIYVISKTNADTMTYSDLQAGSTLTKDYKELVKSRPVLEEVLAETGIDVELKNLEAQITVEVPQDTRIVSITVEDKDPYEARIIADSVRIAASKHIREVMDTEAVNVVEEASLPIEKSSPSILKNTAIGYAVGLFLAIAIVIINYIMDDTIKTPDDVEKFLGVSVLGSIPYSENDLSDKAEMERYEKKKKQRKKKQKEEKVFGKDEPMSEAARIHEERRMQNVKATPESRIKEFSITDLDETNV
ncbi:MAG: Wzz/FepE/Etk N-terminal domain-containing protein [Lachnospiraceae bacterium]|nr:Wzz/FepE/Etk N-terminal domain-containing protein [Lachnospiraceae bacterium]